MPSISIKAGEEYCTITQFEHGSTQFLYSTFSIFYFFLSRKCEIRLNSMQLEQASTTYSWKLCSYVPWGIHWYQTASKIGKSKTYMGIMSFCSYEQTTNTNQWKAVFCCKREI